MISIGRNYLIDNDPLNWILVRSSTTKPKDGTAPVETFVNESYHGTLESLFAELYDKTIRAQEYQTLKELVKKTEETKEYIKSCLSGLEKHGQDTTVLKGVKRNG